MRAGKRPRRAAAAEVDDDDDLFEPPAPPRRRSARDSDPTYGSAASEPGSGPEPRLKRRAGRFDAALWTPELSKYSCVYKNDASWAVVIRGSKTRCRDLHVAEAFFEVYSELVGQDPSTRIRSGYNAAACAYGLDAYMSAHAETLPSVSEPASVRLADLLGPVLMQGARLLAAKLEASRKRDRPGGSSRQVRRKVSRAGMLTSARGLVRKAAAAGGDGDAPPPRPARHRSSRVDADVFEDEDGMAAIAAAAALVEGDMPVVGGSGSEEANDDEDDYDGE